MLSVPYIMVNSNSNKATPDGVKVKVNVERMLRSLSFMEVMGSAVGREVGVNIKSKGTSRHVAAMGGDAS